MKRILIVIGVFALLVAACSGSSDSQVASLIDTVERGSEESDEGAALSDEESILAFAACMRENGVEDFEDPDIDSDGGVQFRFRGQADGGEIDREVMQGAFEACGDLLQNVAFGGGDVDRSEIEDQLYEFAACMRDQGIDVDDPDFSVGPGEGGGGLFGDGFDPSDPETAAALEMCQGEFGGLGSGPGGGAGGGPGGSRPGGAPGDGGQGA